MPSPTSELPSSGRPPESPSQLGFAVNGPVRVREGEGPCYPTIGDTLGDCRLLAELGRGARGRVFLAVQPALGDRPVVLKLTPCTGREHLSLARLQHTHIVPLYFAYDDAARGVRVLGMPYYGGATLTQVLDRLRDKPVAVRTGRDILDVLDQCFAGSFLSVPATAVMDDGGDPGHPPPAPTPAAPDPRCDGAAERPPPQSAAREVLARLGYVEAVCLLGAGLADALHYAHELGLVHL